MKGLILTFLLGRGGNKVVEILSKSVRHAVGAAGGAMVSGGLITLDDVSVLQGAAAIGVSVVWSFARAFVGKYA